MSTKYSLPERPERFLTWSDLFARGLVNSKTQARRLWARGAFPRPVHLSQRTIAFRESEVEAWAATRSVEWNESGGGVEGESDTAGTAETEAETADIDTAGTKAI